MLSEKPRSAGWKCFLLAFHTSQSISTCPLQGSFPYNGIRGAEKGTFLRINQELLNSLNPWLLQQVPGLCRVGFGEKTSGFGPSEISFPVQLLPLPLLSPPSLCISTGKFQAIFSPTLKGKYFFTVPVLLQGEEHFLGMNYL